MPVTCATSNTTPGSGCGCGSASATAEYPVSPPSCLTTDALARQRRIIRWHPLRALNAINVRVLVVDLLTVHVQLQLDGQPAHQTLREDLPSLDGLAPARRETDIAAPNRPVVTGSGGEPARQPRGSPDETAPPYLRTPEQVSRSRDRALLIAIMCRCFVNVLWLLGMTSFVCDRRGRLDSSPDALTTYENNRTKSAAGRRERQRRNEGKEALAAAATTAKALRWIARIPQSPTTPRLSPPALGLRGSWSSRFTSFTSVTTSHNARARLSKGPYVHVIHGPEAPAHNRHQRDSPLWSAVRRRDCRPGIARLLNAGQAQRAVARPIRRPAVFESGSLPAARVPPAKRGIRNCRVANAIPEAGPGGPVVLPRVAGRASSPAMCSPERKSRTAPTSAVKRGQNRHPVR